MADMPVVEFQSERSKDLADCYSTLADLRFVMTWCKRIIELLDVANEGEAVQDEDAARAYWAAAIVAYARVFGTGKRFGLQESVLDLIEPDPREFHRWIINMRNKHVAHSVSPLEQLKIGVVLAAEDEPERRPEGVAHLLLTYGLPVREGPNQLGWLASKLHSLVEERARSLADEVLSEARSMPADELYALPRLTVAAPGGQAAGEVRP